MMRQRDRPKYRENDPRYHTSRVKNVFGDMIDHLRKDATVVEDPRAKALFEVSAEVIGGLRRAFDDYEGDSEPAWK